MKKILLSKLGLAVVFFILGLGAHYLYKAYQEGDLEDHFEDLKDKVEDIQEDITDGEWISDQLETMGENLDNKVDFEDSFFDDFFDEDYFDKFDEPFEEMNRARSKLNEKFKKLDKKFNQKFNGWFKKKFGGGSLKDIKSSSNDDFVYYTLDIDGDLTGKVYVKTSGDWVIVSGIVKNSDKRMRKGFTNTREYHSNFKRVLPVPKGVDSSKSQVEVKDGRIVILFPKK